MQGIVCCDLFESLEELYDVLQCWFVVLYGLARGIFVFTRGVSVLARGLVFLARRARVFGGQTSFSNLYISVGFQKVFESGLPGICPSDIAYRNLESMEFSESRISRMRLCACQNALIQSFFVHFSNTISNICQICFPPRKSILS